MIILSILADLSNINFWMFFTSLLICKCSSSMISPLIPVKSVPIKIGITLTFMCHSFFFFFSSLARSKNNLFFTFFQFYPVISQNGKFHNSQVLYFLFIYQFIFADRQYVWSSGRHQVISLYLKIEENFLHLFLQDGFNIVDIPFFVCSNSNFLYISQWITFPN